MQVDIDALKGIGLQHLGQGERRETKSLKGTRPRRMVES